MQGLGRQPRLVQSLELEEPAHCATLGAAA
jgi:hypothetical protein